MELQSTRRDYRHGRLEQADLDASPFEQFNGWLQDAVDASVQDATAMCLATVGADGKPSQRMVLLKQFDDAGLVFFTNLESRKAREIADNANVSMNFPWLELDRQVCVEGTAARLGTAEVLRYFVKRPRESQLAAWASAQSRPLSSRAIIEGEFLRLKEKFAAGVIPLPSTWGGYRVTPARFEFWQGRVNRLHDRFEYTLDEQGVEHRKARTLTTHRDRDLGEVWGRRGLGSG